MADKKLEKKELEVEVHEECSSESENQLEEKLASQRRILEELQEVNEVQELGEVITVKEVVGEGPTCVVSATQSVEKEKDDQLALLGETQVDQGLPNEEGSLSGSKSPLIDCDDKASDSGLDNITTVSGLKRKRVDEPTHEFLKKIKSGEESNINQTSNPKRDQEEEATKPIDEQQEEKDSKEMDDGGL